MTSWHNQIVGQMKTIEIRTEESFRSAVGPVADKNKVRETTDQPRVDLGTLITEFHTTKNQVNLSHFERLY